MTLRAEFAMRHSDLEGFLSEPIWKEPNGCMLSILSAFARLGMDPWQEAARLAAMPREAAAVALAKVLRRLPSPGEEPDHGALARQLVEELPKRDSRRPADAQAGSSAGSKAPSTGKPSAKPGWSATNIVLLLALACLLGFLQAAGQLF